jgi:uncharacterized protein (TIGR03435 family)
MSPTIAATVLAACSLVRAQPAAAKLEFEVASIKPATLPGRGPIRLGQRGGPGSGDPGRVTYTFSTMLDLLADAYSVKRNQISGGPTWLDSERFDIVAKIPAGATKEQVNVMLQNLLAERFKLMLHRETKELPVYALVVGPKGPKLKDTAVIATPPAAPPPPLPPRLGIRGMKLASDGCPETLPAARSSANFTMMTPNGECMISNAQTMDGLAKQLSTRFDRPVIDQTGLTGTYDLRLRYDPSSIPAGRGGAMSKDTQDDPGPTPAGADPENRIASDRDAPGIFNALQQQLGLKLEAKKAPVDLLVIDRIDRTPAPN